MCWLLGLGPTGLLGTPPARGPRAPFAAAVRPHARPPVSRSLVQRPDAVPDPLPPLQLRYRFVIFRSCLSSASAPSGTGLISVVSAPPPTASLSACMFVTASHHLCLRVASAYIYTLSYITKLRIKHVQATNVPCHGPPPHYVPAICPGFARMQALRIWAGAHRALILHTADVLYAGGLSGSSVVGLS
jgi:hypothetical protein